MAPHVHVVNAGDGRHAHPTQGLLDMYTIRHFKKDFTQLTVAIVGDIDRAKTKALVETYFGPLKSGPKVAKPTVTTPPITSERRVTVTDRIQLPRLYMAWLSPKMYTQEDADADVAGAALGGGRFSRLYRSLVYEKQIAQDVSAYQQSMMLVSSFMIQATARPGHTLEELEAAIDAEVAKLQQEGPEPWELELARNSSETNTVRGLERLGGFGGVADQLNDYNHYVGDPGFLRKDLQRVSVLVPERGRVPHHVHLWVGVGLAVGFDADSGSRLRGEQACRARHNPAGAGRPVAFTTVRQLERPLRVYW
mgnify:CR=1 FL=1